MRKYTLLLALLVGCPAEAEVETEADGGIAFALDADSGVEVEAYDDIEPLAYHVPPHADPEADEWVHDEDAGEPDVCDWEDTGDRTIVWCDGVDYHCCVDEQLDSGHWRDNCPGYCDEGSVPMEDFRVIGPSSYGAGLYCVEDRGQCAT